MASSADKICFAKFIIYLDDKSHLYCNLDDKTITLIQNTIIIVNTNIDNKVYVFYCSNEF